MTPLVMGFLSKPLNALIGGAAAVTVGVGIGLAGAAWWDYHAPFGWGLGQRLDKRSAELGTAQANLTICRGDRDHAIGETWRWSGAYKRLEAARAKDATEAGKRLAAATMRSQQQCKAAFRAGVTAGRALSGGKNDATTPGSIGGPPPDGLLDDLRADWSVNSAPDGARP